jgi:hypothetical protein
MRKPLLLDVPTLGTKKATVTLCDLRTWPQTIVMRLGDVQCDVFREKQGLANFHIGGLTYHDAMRGTDRDGYMLYAIALALCLSLRAGGPAPVKGQKVGLHQAAGATGEEGEKDE